MQFETIVDEVVAEMVQPAEVVENNSLAIAMFDRDGKHIFSIQRATDVETQKLVLELRAWIKQGMEKVLDRVNGSKAFAATSSGEKAV